MTTNFEAIKQNIMMRLTNELHPGLVYHNPAHTLDLLEQAIYLAKEEGIVSEHELLLIKTAAVYHDSGFLYSYKDHEEHSCEIARKDLSALFTETDISKICGMIMATKIPQTPHSLAEQIICDADLDYLGRDDFAPISETLYREFIEFGIVSKDADWDQIQIKFFETHHYFTATANARRNNGKLEHLQNLKARKKQYP